MTTDRHALIIGGSLGGLFAAHLLRTIGWRVDVFERSSEDLAGRGAGLGTHEPLIAVLRRIGLDAGATRGVGTHAYVWLDARGGVARELPLSRVMTAWSRLYRPLRDALPDQHYHPGKSLVRVEQDDACVTAVFADGTRAAGDLLIAADGARSTVRAQLLPHSRPEYAGYVAWRSLTAEADIAPGDRGLLLDRNAFCIPEGELAVSYPVPARDGDLRPGKRDYNIVWYRPTSTASFADLNTDAAGRHHEQIPPPLIRADVVAGVKAAAQALLAPSIAAIFMRTERPIFQPIYDFASPQLVFGRIALLGDAAFVARPHVGAGVTKAALDAECLADVLAANHDIHAGLARYDRVRQCAGAWIVARARAFGARLIFEAAGRPPASGQGRRSGRMFEDYAGLPAEVRDWAARAVQIFPIFASSITFFHLAISALM